MLVLLYKAFYVAMWAYWLRSVLVICMMLIAIWGDNPASYTYFTTDIDLFQHQFSWAKNIRSYDPSAMADITNQTLAFLYEYYFKIDFVLEAANVIWAWQIFDWLNIGIKVWEPLA